MAKLKGKTISIFSAKGGTGKTVFTLNLAGILSNLNKKVLIIDLDLAGGGIALALNKLAEKNIYSAVDDLNNSHYKSIKDYITNYNEYIDFLASPKDPRNATRVDSKFIDIIIDDAASNYDVVLIDTNHMLYSANLVMLDKVDNILFLLTNDPFDLKNMKSLLSIFSGLGFDNYKVVLNNAIANQKDYFSLADIKNIIKTDISYILSPSLYIKNIDSLVINGEIYTLNKKTFGTRDYGVLLQILTDLYKKGENNEKR